MTDIIEILARALGISKNKLFDQASPLLGNTMYEAYRNRGEIPAPILAYCRTLTVCHKCGADLRSRKTNLVGKKDGIDLRECFGGCLPKKEPPKPKEEKETAKESVIPDAEPPIRFSVGGSKTTASPLERTEMQIQDKASKRASINRQLSADDVRKKWEEELG